MKHSTAFALGAHQVPHLARFSLFPVRLSRAKTNLFFRIFIKKRINSIFDEMEKQENTGSNSSMKKLSKSELVDLDLRGQIHGARLNMQNLLSLLEAKAKGNREMLYTTPEVEISPGYNRMARFNVFDQFFGEVDLLQGKFYLIKGCNL